MRALPWLPILIPLHAAAAEVELGVTTKSGEPAAQVQPAPEARLEARLDFSPRQRRVPSGATVNEYSSQ